MPTIKAQYDARLGRVMDAVAVREPDRVPLGLSVQAFPYYWAGITIADAMADFRVAGQALDKYYGHFKPDIGFDPSLMYYSKYMKTTGITWFQWPGEHFEDKNQSYQFIEGEYMKADEYPEAIRDMTKFMMNKWLPRCFTELKGLSKIDFRDSMWFNHLNTFFPFSDPEVKHALHALMKAGDELLEWFTYLGEYGRRMMEVHGIPSYAAGFAFAPFDMIGDSMRGTVEILMDMYDRPEELLELIGVVTDFAIKDTIAGCSGRPTPFVIFWLHKGVDDFMSDEQFAKFYWPSLRKYATALIEAGLVPLLFCEGAYNTRLEHLRDLPSGKAILSFEHTDMAKAKKILGGHSCIKGNIPASLLAFGTKEEVVSEAKRLIDVCAPGGGYIMDTGTLLDNARTENVEALFDTTFTYGSK